MIINNASNKDFVSSNSKVRETLSEIATLATMFAVTCTIILATSLTWVNI